MSTYDYKRIADMTDEEFLAMSDDNYERYMNDVADDYEDGPRVGETRSEVKNENADKETVYTFELTIRGTVSSEDEAPGVIEDLLQMAKGHRQPDDKFVVESLLMEDTFWLTEVVNVSVVSAVEEAATRGYAPVYDDDDYLLLPEKDEPPVLKGR